MEGRILHIYTDHKPLTFTISSNADRSPRQTRHLSFVTEFITDVRHIPGKTNVVVDMLSRVRTPDEITSPSPLSSVSAVTQNDSINYNEMSRARVNDCGLQAYRSTATALVLRDIELENGVTVFVTCSHQRLDLLYHVAGSEGFLTRFSVYRTRFVWHGMNKDITAWAKMCLACQRARIHHHVTAPLQQFATPDGRLKKIRQYPRGHRGSAPIIVRYIVLVHDCRSLHALARSHTEVRCYCIVLCKSAVGEIVAPLRCTH